MAPEPPETPLARNFEYEMPNSLKTFLRVGVGLTCLAVILYMLSVLLGARHHFDKDGAVDLVQTTKRILSQENDKNISSKQLDSLHSKIAKALSKDSYYLNLDHFANTGSSDSSFVISYNAADADLLIKKLQALPDTTFRDRETMDAFIYKGVGAAFKLYNFDQFVNENNFWNDAEDVFKILLVILSVLVGFLFFLSATLESRQRLRFERKTQYAAALETSTNITQSWVTAQATLDTYHRRNLDQNNWTFRLSVIVMAIGFGIIIYGIHAAIELNTLSKGLKGGNNGTTLIAILSTASGVIINLIGGTFLAIYNSTLKQAIDYTNSLQKTSTVGTSLAILNSIDVGNHSDDGATATKLIDAKIAIARQLIDTGKA